jgi:hypothetical protein
MNCVINPTKCTATSITASNKIATWISGLLHISLVDDKQLAIKALQSKQDTVFVVNGMFGFCDFRKEIELLCANAREVIWIGNDYMCKLPTNLKGKSNLRRIAQYDNFDGISNHKLVDFNKLLFFDGAKRAYRNAGMFYYGAFRQNRIDNFKKWFSQSEVPVHISTSQKNSGNFAAINRNAKIYKANGDIKKFIHFFQSSIYIEDKVSSKIQYTPANRFYEVIGSKVLLLYDIQAKNTLSRAGYWDDIFSVSSPAEYAEKLKQSESLREKQIEMFRGRDFKSELNREFFAAL